MAILRTKCIHPDVSCFLRYLDVCRVPCAGCMYETLNKDSELMLSSFQHDVKIWPSYYREVLAGNKKFEIRVNDRGYKVGDVLLLREWDPDNETYTGRFCKAAITYLLDSFAGLSNDLCIMSTEVFYANAWPD